MQEFTSSGTFNVPSGVTCVLVTMIGGGGGGNTWPGTAGGAAGICVRAPMIVTSGGTLAITIGAKGSGAKTIYNSDTDGGDSIVGPFRAGGGFAAAGQQESAKGGAGGGCNGAAGAASNMDGFLAPRSPGSPNLAIQLGQYSAWWAGGGGGGTSNSDGRIGCPGVNNHSGGAAGGPKVGTGSGGGGGSTYWGQGASGGAGSSSDNGHDATASHYGVGGGGASNAGIGGDGAPGYVLIECIA